MKRTPVDNSKVANRRYPADIAYPSKPKPQDFTLVKKTYWSFSFKYFKQIENFGFDKVGTDWFVSFLDRLKETCHLEYSGFSQSLEDGLRYHKIDWTWINVPIQRNEFTWVDKKYLENALEYEFYQFHVSKGKGRIVGFWDENNVFQIVLLDPFHNIQPSKYSNYQIRECYPIKSEFDSLLHDIDQLKRNPCDKDACNFYKKLAFLPTKFNYNNVLVAYLDDEFFKTHTEILKTKTFSEIVEAGILACC